MSKNVALITGAMSQDGIERTYAWYLDQSSARRGERHG